MFTFVEEATYLVRDLLAVPLEAMINSPEARNIYLQFDDGTIPSSSRECIHARMLWYMYDIFPVKVVSKRHHLHHYRRIITPGTDSDILNDISWRCYFESTKLGAIISLDTRCRKIEEITDLLDDFYHRVRNHAVFVDSGDFIRLRKHPEIEAVNNELQLKDTVVSADIGGAYAKVKRVIETDKGIRLEPLVMAFRSNSIKKPSFNKLMAPLGFITDVDSHIFRPPVLDSYLSGVTSIRDLIMESRTAAMSNYYQESAMQQSEYLTRMLQLVSANMFRVHKHTDCGSRKYASLYIGRPSDLEDMEGIFYLDEDSDELKPISVDSMHLCGRLVKIRTMLGCKLGDRYGVCSTCYGQLSHSIFDTDNIGHLAASTLQQIVTQMILSNKHVVASATGSALVLTPEDNNYVQRNPSDEMEYILNPRLAKERVSISFSPAAASRLQDIQFMEDDLRSASPMRLSQLDEVIFRVYRDDLLAVEYPINLSVNSTKAFFTMDMLKYMRESGWYVNSAGMYELDLSGWDYSSGRAAFGMPPMQFSTPEHMLAIKSMLATSKRNDKDNKSSLSRYATPEAALMAFRDLVKMKINVNFTHLQTVVAAYLCQDPENYDFRIPKDKSTGTIMPYSTIMVNRDMAQAMSYQEHLDTFKSLSTYVIDQRHIHPHNSTLKG